MEFEIIIRYVLVAINAIGIALVWWVARSDSEKKLKIWFSVMTISMLLWANFSYFAVESTSIILSATFYRLNWAAVSVFLPSFYYFYVIQFLGKGRVAKFIGGLIALVSMALLIVSLLTNLLIADVVPREWGMEIVFGPLGIFFNAFSLAVALTVIFYSLKEYSKASPEMRSRLRTFLVGVFIFITANIVFNVFSQSLFNSVQYQFLGDFSSIFLLGFTAYATIQHKLFDAKVLATEGITVFLWVVLFSRIFGSQSAVELVIDLSVFVMTVIFGLLLIRSVRREVEQRRELEILNKKLEEMDDRKDEFISVAAHELRAPMTAIKGYLSMISDGDAGEIPQKAKEFLSESMTANERLIRMVNNMLNISRIEEGRLIFEIGRMDLAEVVDSAFRQYKVQAEEKNLNYALDISPNLAGSVTVDKDRIFEVVSNFISNAIKYTEAGSVTVKVFNPNPSVVRFEVVDTGLGLSEDEVAKLFQKFYRAESNIGKAIGSGLGLYISKLLVEKFNGRVGVHSVKNQGSTFWFELPVILS